MKWILTILLVLVTGYFSVRWYIDDWGHRPGSYATLIELEISPRSGVRAIAHLLAKKGVISSPWMFEVYLRMLKPLAVHRLQAGEYEFQPNMTPEQVVEKLRQGLVKQYLITIPEGSTKEDIAYLLEKSGLVSQEAVLKQMEQAALLKEFGVPACVEQCTTTQYGGVEGYLFPDTYRLTKRMTIKEMLKKMRNRLDDILDDVKKAQMKTLGVDLHHVLTLASIVEKETGASLERPLIAGVFWNRLRKGMPLQSDPTAMYGQSLVDRKLRKQHLKSNNAYNTYTHTGLPPGPIASPGMLAIQAVLWPTQSKYLYFVSKNDGTHQFCETYACHRRAVQKWQIRYFRGY